MRKLPGGVAATPERHILRAARVRNGRGIKKRKKEWEGELRGGTSCWTSRKK